MRVFYILMNFGYLATLHPFDSPEDLELLDASIQAASGLSPTFDLLTIPGDLPALDLEGNFCNPQLLALTPEIEKPRAEVLTTVTIPIPAPATPAKEMKKIGGLTFEERLLRVNRYREKRGRRVWNRKVSYQCRKKVADNRIRIKGRFVTKEDALKLLKGERSNSVGL